MATDITTPQTEMPPLRAGDRMTRAEFKRRCAALPEKVTKHAELRRPDLTVHVSAPDVQQLEAALVACACVAEWCEGDAATWWAAHRPAIA